MDEEAQFKAVLGFLERFETEVSGRSAELLDPETETKIRGLVDGILDDNEREQLLEEISRNRACSKLLASCLRN